ncbi:hypothetical protein QI155_10550, partial [Thermodesulfovibrio sp. 1176]|uniref:hypothetical protein n=1 Tax=Thermodesulfovibrio sp. 1176 TaxID=3043424 RepID=UPI0024825377
TPITSPGKLPKTETQTLKMDGPGLESRLDNVLGLPEGKYKIFKQVENKINTGKQGIEQKLVDIRKEVEPFIKNPSGDPKAVPIAVNPEFIKSPNYENFREKLSTFDKSFTDIRDAQEFVRHNPWLLGTLEKLRESGVNPEVIAPNLYKAYKTINTPITSPGKLPKTETQTLKMDGPGLESRLDNVLGLPEGKYKIFGK